MIPPIYRQSATSTPPFIPADLPLHFSLQSLISHGLRYLYLPTRDLGVTLLCPASHSIKTYPSTIFAHLGSAPRPVSHRTLQIVALPPAQLYIARDPINHREAS